MTKLSLLGSLALVVLVASLASAELHSRIANHVERIGDNRYTFCMHSVAVPTDATFTAALYFSFADVDGNPVDEVGSFVVGFPNSEFKLIRAVASGHVVTVHQGTSSYFNWDADSYRYTGFTTGVVVSEHQLIGVTLVVEAAQMQTVEDGDRFTCDAPVFFVDENQDDEPQEPFVQPGMSAAPQFIGEPEEFISAQTITMSGYDAIYIASIVIVALMTLGCCVRICRARRAPVLSDEEMMFPIDENESAPAPVAEGKLYPQAMMTAAGIQYVMVPQDFVAQQQQQQPVGMPIPMPMYALYPGQYAAATSQQ